MRVFGDILAFLREGILRDVEEPTLWSDEILCECITKAHDEFAERTLFLRDSTSTAASFVLEAGVELYPLDPSALAVLSAKLDGAANNLVRAGSIAIDGYVPPPDTISWLETINYGAALTGTPLTFTTDYSVDGDTAGITIRLWPVPDATVDGQTVRLRIVRLPAVQCSTDTLETVPECPRQFLLALAHGAAAVAYGLQDSDAKDDTRADKQRAIFEKYLKDAERGTRRKLFAPLAWGFGRAGFSHSR